MIISATELTTTRLCRASNCPDDADPYALFCTRHDRQRRRGVTVPLHVTPAPLPPSLPCSKCKRELVDAAFPIRTTTGGRKSTRRGRGSHCRECGNAMRKDWHAQQKALVESEIHPQGVVE